MKDKATNILLAGLLTGALVLTGCGKGSVGGGYVTTAGKMDYSEANLADDSRRPIGEISGTITLTDVPSSAPKVYISVKNTDNSNWWHSKSGVMGLNGSGRIDLISGNSTNLSWSIPVYEDDGFSPSNGYFTLHVSPAGNGIDSFWVDIPTTPYIGSVNAGGIDLGTVSINSITLNGTVNLAHNGRPVQWVHIQAKTADGKLVGLSRPLSSYTANEPWSITMPAINSDVTFWVFGVGNDEWLIDRGSILPVSAGKSEIALNAGDISPITPIDTTPVTTEAPDSAETVLSGGNKDEDKVKNEAPVSRQDPAPVSVNNQVKPETVSRQVNIINSGNDDYDRVIDDYTRMIQVDPNSADIYHSRGFAYYNKREYDLAIADYTKAIQIDPKNAVTYNNRGAAYNNKGNYELAIADLDQAIRLNPDFESPYRHRAFACLKKGNYRQARADINKAMQIHPGNKIAQDISAELQRLGF